MASVGAWGAWSARGGIGTRLAGAVRGYGAGASSGAAGPYGSAAGGMRALEAAYGLERLGGAPMEETQRSISDIRVSELAGTSQYVRPFSILFKQGSRERRWDMVKSLPSVSVLLYHTEKNAFLLVRQFRPAALCSARFEAEAEGRPDPGLEAGFTFEMCAGLKDKAGKTYSEVCSEEILEETGFKVAPEMLLPVSAFLAAVGTSGSSQRIYFAEVDDSMRAGAGGGLASDGEAIEVVALPVNRAADFVCDPEVPKSSGLMFAVQWFLRQRGL